MKDGSDKELFELDLGRGGVGLGGGGTILTVILAILVILAIILPILVILTIILIKECRKDIPSQFITILIRIDMFNGHDLGQDVIGVDVGWEKVQIVSN